MLDTYKVVSVKILDPDSTLLYNLIKTDRVYGPYGSLNMNWICMIDRKCRKQSPKDFPTKEREMSVVIPSINDKQKLAGKSLNILKVKILMLIIITKFPAIHFSSFVFTHKNIDI